MKASYVLMSILACSALISCSGDDSGAFRTNLSGDWHGPLRQTGCLICNNSEPLCVGDGFLVGSADLTITSTESIDGDTQDISAKLNNCSYSGQRTQEDSVTLQLISGECSSVMTISDITLGSIVVNFPADDPHSSPAGLCNLSSWGTLERNS